VGKPNPLMMREALRAIDAHSEQTVMIGDRMDTDILAGIEAGLRTVLVLSGITARQQAERFPFLPSRIVGSVADLVEEISEQPAPGPAAWPPRARRAAGDADPDQAGSPTGAAPQTRAAAGS
jgi:HAD-hyrolase-like